MGPSLLSIHVIVVAIAGFQVLSAHSQKRLSAEICTAIGGYSYCPTTDACVSAKPLQPACPRNDVCNPVSLLRYAQRVQAECDGTNCAWDSAPSLDEVNLRACKQLAVKDWTDKCPGLCAASPQYSSDTDCELAAAAGVAGANGTWTEFDDKNCSGLECTFAECCSPPQQCSATAYGDDTGCEIVAAVVAVGTNFTNSRPQTEFEPTLCAGLKCTFVECCSPPQLCSASAYSNDTGCEIAAAAVGASGAGTNDTNSTVRPQTEFEPTLCAGLECTFVECCSPPQLCSASAYSNDTGCEIATAAGAGDSNVSWNEFDATNCSGLKCTFAECCSLPRACTRPAQTAGYNLSQAVEVLRISRFAVTNPSCASGFHSIANESVRATVCQTELSEYTLSGCTPNICVRPTDTIGYDVANIAEVLSAPNFSVASWSCASEYRGSAVATACESHNESYTIAGCTANTCMRPADLLGFDVLGATEELRISVFDVSDALCAVGFNGSPNATACSGDGQEYVLSGCKAHACTRPADLAGFDVSGATENLTMLFPPFAVADAMCAVGYAGTPIAAVCASDGAEYSLSGCLPQGCTRPENVSGYEFASAQEVLVIATFALTGVTCDTAGGYSGAGGTATVCASLDAEYTLAGCAANVCIRPVTLTGYDVTSVQETSLSAPDFAVSGPS